jgi:uncharacterized protein (TIRG00374 family)
MRKHMWIGYLFAAICLYFAFRGISLPQFVETLAKAKFRWVFLAILIYLIDMSLRAERWAILIKPIQAIGARDLFWPMIIGFFANNILPLRMGEVVRAHVCGTKFKISRAGTLGSIFLERIGDTLAFLTTFLAASLFYPFPPYMEKGAWLLGGACLLAIVIMVLIRRHESLFHAVLERSPLPSSWKNRINHLATHFINSTSGITQPRYVVEAMALSLIVWILEGSYLYLMSKAFAINLKYGEAFFLLFALGLSVTLPQAPGYVGTFEFFGVTALTLLGISKNQGLPLILAVHGTQFAFVGILGVLGMWREDLSFHNLTTT